MSRVSCFLKSFQYRGCEVRNLVWYKSFHASKTNQSNKKALSFPIISTYVRLFWDWYNHVHRTIDTSFLGVCPYNAVQKGIWILSPVDDMKQCIRACTFYISFHVSPPIGLKNHIQSCCLLCSVFVSATDLYLKFQLEMIPLVCYPCLSPLIEDSSIVLFHRKNLKPNIQNFPCWPFPNSSLIFFSYLALR